MGENDKQVAMFLELRRRLQSGLLVLRRDEAWSGSSGEAVVTRGESSINVQTPEGLQCLELPAGVRLVEQGPFTGVPWEAGEELHFRLRLNIDQTIDKESWGSVMERLQVRESYSFHCQTCETRLLEERVFRRVLPLPNGNWNALVGDWCCHPDPFANRKLLPRAEDCLLGDTYLLLARDGGCEETLAQEVGPASVAPVHGPRPSKQKTSLTRMLVSCKSCSSGLGEAPTPGTLKLYVTEVTVRQSAGDSQYDTSIERSLFLERTLAARLVELSSTQSVFRFCLHTPDGKSFLLMWLLNSDSLIASLSEAEEEEEEEAGGGDVPPRPPPRQSRRARGAVKVAYLPCDAPGVQQQDIIYSWENIVSVHPLELPPTTCQEVLQVLTASTSCLPPSLRAMNSYEVAYMRL